MRCEYLIVCVVFFFSSRRRHTRCALVTGVQTCALPISLEAQDNIGVEVAAKLVRYSDNGSTLSAVNFPEVTLPGHAGSRRLLHIHRNVPGVLSQVNEVFGSHSVNIDGQYLRTDANVGYVVIDVDADERQAVELRAALAAIPGTLRTRVLY